MSPQEVARNHAIEFAEQSARAMLGVDLKTAFAMLDDGRLAGTVAESELQTLRLAIERYSSSL
jgi:hypothetical protein